MNSSSITGITGCIYIIIALNLDYESSITFIIDALRLTCCINISSIQSQLIAPCVLAYSCG